MIVSNAKENSVSPIVSQLEKMGEKFYRFDTETFPTSKEAKISFSGSIMSLSGYLKSGEDRVDLQRVKSVWYRKPAGPLADKKLNGIYREFAEEESRAFLWSFYTATNEILWVNPPLISRYLLEHNKLYQLKVASSVGLKVPDTLLTNSPNELRDFFNENNGFIVVKTLKPAFVEFNKGKPFFVYTNKVSSEHLNKYIEEVRLAPVLAQTYIKKKVELRVTIVKDKVFSCAIYSQDSPRTLHDWRKYDFSRVKHEPYKLPIEVESRLLELMRRWGLYFGAIDMILTPDNEYVFLEINPNGQWGWIEALTRMPITKSLAELLATGKP